MALSCSSYHHSTSSVVAVVVLFALLFSSSTTHSSQAAVTDPLLPICKTVGGGGIVGVDFCLSALGSDKRSRGGAHSYRDLSIIAVDLLTSNVTRTAEKIDRLLQNGGAGAAAQTLLSCQALYMEIGGRLPGCTDTIKSGGFKMVQANLRLSASDVERCEAWFAESHVALPLKVEDDNAVKLAKLADGLLDHAI